MGIKNMINGIIILPIYFKTFNQNSKGIYIYVYFKMNIFLIRN